MSVEGPFAAVPDRQSGAGAGKHTLQASETSLPAPLLPSWAAGAFRADRLELGPLTRVLRYTGEAPTRVPLLYLLLLLLFLLF